MRNVINWYFDFWKALYLRYKELKSSYGKDRAKVLIKKEVKKQIPETKFSDKALQKRRRRLRKFILNLSNNNVNYVIAEILRAEQRDPKKTR
uniref:Uncharacterized protein n=1 Tax=Rhizophagus irregularis (strain DAOM 181602 / DAOM 197198 / MUCL 43194) TaxID=747089 RepID=U9UBP0_RHIID